MASVASQLIEAVTAHAQSDSLKDAREICADGTYFLNNLHMFVHNILLLSSYFRLQFLEFMLPLKMVSSYWQLSEARSLNNYLAQQVSSQVFLSTFHDIAQA